MALNFKLTPVILVGLDGSGKNSTNTSNNTNAAQKINFKPDLVKAIGTQSDGTPTELKLKSNGSIF